MKKICQIMGMSEDDTFKHIESTMKDSITQWDYFVNWKKVLCKIEEIEHELNLLNTLIGKEDIIQESKKLLSKYPSIIKAIPSLLAIREDSVKVLVEVNDFVYREFDFSANKPTPEQLHQFSLFIQNSGLGALLKNKDIKNLVDYVIGVEVGLDTNARKNRTGSLMEKIVKVFVARDCQENQAIYMPQATTDKLKFEWGIDIGGPRRVIDFAIKKKEKLFFIETNFYKGGGSKLKSTATEYGKMNEIWNKKGIDFIWITDGLGWKGTLGPLREYFNSADYLINLKMLSDGCLNKIIKNSE